MSINKTKLYIVHYGSFLFVPLFFFLVFSKGIFDSFFDALVQTSGGIKEHNRVFDHKKSYTDNQ